MKYAFKALLLTVALLGGLSLRAWNAADYKEGAEAGDAVAQYNLGVCYERGYGVDKDLSEALKWYSRSAEGDYQNAQYRAALFKYNAWGTAKDLEGAAALARKAAAAGHPGASALFGVMLWKGEGVERNLDEAAKCLSFASGKGNAEAQFNYFKLLDEGVVEPKSPGDAMNALEKSAAQSFAPAQFELAMRLLAGEDAAKNVRRARELLIAAGKNGIQKAEAVLNELFPEIKPDAKVSDADLILSVSEAFKKGFGGVAPDEAKSKDLLQAAAKKGSPEAKLRVGVAAFDAGDFENAANLLKEAAWKLPEAQYRYGLMLNEGKGVQADPPKAIDYFRRAAQGGVKEAALIYGRELLSGEKVKKSTYSAFKVLKPLALEGNVEARKLCAEAILAGGSGADEASSAQILSFAAAEGDKEAVLKYVAMAKAGRVKDLKESPEQLYGMLSKLADSGDMRALVEKGVCLASGYGVGKDVDAAFLCYFKAAEAGEKSSFSRLADAYIRGEGTIKNPAKYFEWCVKAAEAGDRGRYLAAGIAYATGHGVEKSPEKAFACYSKAAETGAPKALYYLGVCHLKGFGTPLDEAKGKELLEKAAKAAPDDKEIEAALKKLSAPKDAPKADVKGKQDAKPNRPPPASK